MRLLASLHRRLIFNSSRVHLDAVNQSFANGIPPGSLVLDAGAGGCMYKGLFRHARYESADFRQIDKEYGEITYVCDLRSLPVEDERFDYIVFNQTLEHLQQPAVVLHELSRILKVGGRILCTAPFYYEEHEQPYDFYRYTQFGHRFLFTDAGFEILSIEWMEGYCGTLAYQLDLAVRQLPISPNAYGGGVLGWLLTPGIIVAKILFILLAAALCRLDVRHKVVVGGHPKNYSVLARKTSKAA